MTRKGTYKPKTGSFPDPSLQALADRISQLDENFYILGMVLAQQAKNRSTIASTIKAIVILLGAFVATRETVNLFLDPKSSANVLLFAIVGLLIAVLTGLESSFRFETKSAELRVLATACQTHRWELTPQWARLNELAVIKSDEQDGNVKKVTAIDGILTALEMKLPQVQEKAAALGINVVYDVEHFEQQTQTEKIA